MFVFPLYFSPLDCLFTCFFQCRLLKVVCSQLSQSCITGILFGYPVFLTFCIYLILNTSLCLKIFRLYLYPPSSSSPICSVLPSYRNFPPHFCFQCPQLSLPVLPLPPLQFFLQHITRWVSSQVCLDMSFPDTKTQWLKSSVFGFAASVGMLLLSQILIVFCFCVILILKSLSLNQSTFSSSEIYFCC